VALERLLERLWRGDPHARDELRSLGPDAAPAVPALADAVRSGEPELRCDALFVLEGVGPGARPALPALFEALRDRDGDVSARAADALAALGEAAVDGLVAELGADDAARRQAACRALGVLGTPARAAVPALLACARGDTEEVAMRAIWALGCVRTPAALEPLAEIVADDGGMAGCWAAEALAEYGPDARDVAGALRDELHRDDPGLAIACASALIAIRVHEDAAIWALITLLQTGGDPDLATEAAIVLGECGGAAVAAVPALRAAAHDADDADLRREARLALARIRPEYAADVVA